MLLVQPAEPPRRSWQLHFTHVQLVLDPLSALLCCWAAPNVLIAQHMQLLFSKRMQTRPGVLPASEAECCKGC